MKHNRIYIVIFTIWSCCLFTSCEEFIDLQPLDQITTDNYWKKSGDLENYIIQFYPIFYPYTAMVAQLARHSDNIVNGNPSVILNGERTPTAGSWKDEWEPIRKINIFFENYQKCEDDFTEYQQYLGEAHFFRAWFYFDLLKKYGDLPWYSQVLNVEDEALFQPRQPRTDVANNIIADIDSAILYLSSRKEIGNLRINKEAALAFKTRVALFEGSWQKYHVNTVFGTPSADPNKFFKKCISAAKELMTGDYEAGVYNTGNPDNDYYKMFGFVNMDNINEILLYRAFNLAEGFGNTVEGYLSYNANQKGATWSLISSYLSKNGKPYDYLKISKTAKGNSFLSKIGIECDPRLKSTIYMPGDLRGAEVGLVFEKPTINTGVVQLCPTGFQIKKTTDPYSSGAGQTWEVGSETGLIILRFGEVLLNYAEALYELDGVIAYDALNQLRRRAGMPEFSVNPQSADPNLKDYGYPISDELYEIRRERRVELALEGFRDGDYRRWAAHTLFQNKRPKGYPFDQNEFPEYAPPLDNNGLIDYYRDQLPNGYQFRGDQDYLYSIPQDEITLNPNLNQNPGW